MYGKSIEKKFGHFQSDLECIQFNADLLDDHMAAMFPGYNISEKTVQSNKTQRVNDEISENPSKRPRLSIEAVGDANHDPTNAVTIVKKYMKSIVHEVAALESANNSKAIQMINELNSSKAALQKLEAELKSVSLERDQIMGEMSQAEEVHANEIADIHETYQNLHAKDQMEAKKALADAKSKHDQAIHELEKKLQADHDESVLNTIEKLEAKHKTELQNARKYDIEAVIERQSVEIQKIKDELAKAKSEHSEELKKIVEIHKQQMAKTIADLERAQEEKKKAEEHLNEAIRKHDKDMQNLQTKLIKEGLNSLSKLEAKLEKEHSDELEERRKQYEKQLDCEKNRVSTEIAKWKEEQRRKMVDMKLKLQAAVDENCLF